MNYGVDKINEKLDVTLIQRDELNKILHERLNFAFDSLYFRYATVVDELATYKAQDLKREGRDPEGAKRTAENHKMHFYQVLEQILEAHDTDSPLLKKSR